MAVKSGTHDFHGGLWYFNRNEDYDANNYFTNLAGQQRPILRLNEPGGNIGGPVWIPHVYNNSRNRTFFFVNEEWRRLIVGSTPSIVNTIAASNFPALGQSLTYSTPSNGTTPLVPATSDAAKLAIYAANGLTPGHPFPGNTIPAALIDQNAVRELNAGTFPKPNYGASQYISSVPQQAEARRCECTLAAGAPLPGNRKQGRGEDGVRSNSGSSQIREQHSAGGASHHADKRGASNSVSYHRGFISLHCRHIAFLLRCQQAEFLLCEWKGLEQKDRGAGRKPKFARRGLRTRGPNQPQRDGKSQRDGKRSKGRNRPSASRSSLVFGYFF